MTRTPRTRKAPRPIIISAATTPTRTPPPAKVPAADARKPSSAFAALDVIAGRCRRMEISFASLPAPPPRLPKVRGTPAPTGIGRMCATIEAEWRRFREEPFRVMVCRGTLCAIGQEPATTMRNALAMIRRRVPRFRPDLDTLQTRIAGGPVSAEQFRELARLALTAGFGAAAAPPAQDAVGELERAFGNAREVYIFASETNMTWFDIRTEETAAGHQFRGSFSRSARTIDTEAFRDLIKGLAALRRKPAIDTSTLKITAPGSGLSGKQLRALLLAALATTGIKMT